MGIKMKQIVVCIACTPEQKQNIAETAGNDNCVIFLQDIEDEKARSEVCRRAHIVIGEPSIADIRANKNLEWVQMTWAGTDKYTIKQEDGASGFPKDVLLTNMSGAFGVIMSEYAIGAILAMYRKFPTYWKQQQNGIWLDAGAEESLYGKTALLLGTGDIGSNLAVRLKVFGVKNIGVRRNTAYVPSGFDEMYGFERLDELLPLADIVACSLPNKPLTRGLITKERLLSMKKNAILLNMGRGTLLDLEDLCEVLAAGHLGGVILDVTAPEPLPMEHALWKYDRVMLTPHIAGPSIGHCPATQEKIVNICCENLKRYFTDEPLLHIISDEDFEYDRL